LHHEVKYTVSSLKRQFIEINPDPSADRRWGIKHQDKNHWSPVTGHWKLDIELRATSKKPQNIRKRISNND